MIYAIGDIHGEFLKLANLINKLELEGLRPEDRLLFVGDYVDRGPDSKSVLDLMIKIKAERPNTIFLRGNHDQAMMDSRDIVDPETKTTCSPQILGWWLSYGGRETIHSYGAVDGTWYKKIPEEHWRFLRETVFQYKEGNYIFVHAGLVPPGKKWLEPDDPRLWIREEFIGSKANFGAVVVFGHTPQDLFFPVVMDNKIGIDTGAAYGGPLTAVVIEPAKPYQRDKVRFVQG